MKTDVMARASNAKKLLEVDLTKKENYKSLQSIDIGFAASAACKDTTVQVLKFREDCLPHIPCTHV
jgi:hypothetical protein